MPEVLWCQRFICLLQKFRKDRNISHAKILHADMSNNGMEGHRDVGNFIVQMFVECGSVFHANQIFNRLIHRNVYSWTSLVLGYIECGQAEHAFSLSQRMREENVHPNKHTLLALLKACSRMKDLERGREVHVAITEKGLETDVFVGTTLVDMYAKCGSLLEARTNFDNLPLRNVVSWTVLIAGYAEHGHCEEAVKCFKQMQLEGVLCNDVTFLCILKACGNLGALDKVREIHMEIIQKGFDKSPFIGCTLIDMYTKCGSLSNAQEVFDCLPVQSVVSWTALIKAYSELGYSEEALDCYRRMQLEGVSADPIAFVYVLKACGSLRAIDKGREIHTKITQKGFQNDAFVGTALVDMYAKCGSLSEACEVFDMLQVQDVVSWSALIAGYATHGHYEKAVKCFYKMQLKGVSPNSMTFVFILKACGSVGYIDKGCEIHKEITQRGLEQDIPVANALIEMYAKCGSLLDASKVFNRLAIRSISSWNVLIAGYVSCGCSQDALKCFEQMQLENILPDTITFVSILKACASTGAIKRGREIHKLINETGFEKDPFVCNTLIDMYAKCGSLVEAQKVFDGLPVRDVVSWSALMAGYAEHGPSEEALKCFGMMQLEGIFPNAITFVSILKACGRMGAIDKGREIHMEITLYGFEKDHVVGNSLISMYVKCGLLLEAQRVFDQLQVQDVVSWNILVAGYAEYRLVHEALECFKQMQGKGLSPDAVTYICILKACSSIGAVDKGREIHIEIIQKGYETDLFVGNALLNMYARNGLLADATEVFDRLSVRDVVSWNALITGYTEHGCEQKSLEIFEHMQLQGSFPNAVTFAGALKACGRLGAIDKGREIHVEVRKKGLEGDLFVGNSLVDMYIKCGSLSEAREAFEELPVRDVVLWSTLIAGYAEHGTEQDALNCFGQMQVEGISPNTVTFVCVLKACASIEAIEKGREIHFEIQQKGFQRDLFVGNTLVSMYAKCGSLSEACEVFDKLPVRDVISWNALIAGYVDNGLSQEALKCFERMKLEDILPNVGTYVCSLKACGNIGAFEKGRELHSEVVQMGFEENSFICNTLIIMYAKCGSLSEAQEVFAKLPVHSVDSWNAMINAYGMNHEHKMAVQCFMDMKKQCIKPDALTFICLLTACSYANLVHKGQSFFDIMRSEYGIIPIANHYSCMVDLLARSGLLYKAEKLLDDMPCTPSVETWSSLLSACKTYGEVELGLRCCYRLIQLNPENAASYVLMANIYLNVGSRDDGYTMEELRILAGAKKKPAIALIEANKKVHEFVVGNDQSKELLAMLEILFSHMEEEGHAPNLDLDLKNISDKDKEVFLSEHVERVAIAFGLLNVPRGQMLHITKNMKMCNNCHIANKIISRIEKREIVVRDSYSVHHFKDGFCSCMV